MRYLAGLDLGQAADYSALVIASQQWEEGKAHYGVVHIERFPLRTPYPKIVAAVMERLAAPELVNTTLVVDGTGVGRATVDMFRAHGRRLEAVSIHGGDQVTEVDDYVRVPKRDLVGIIQVLLQTERLKFAADLPDVGLLTNELLNFKVKIDPVTAHDSYSSWREGDHDDLVLSLALSCWYGEWCPKNRNPIAGLLLMGSASGGWFGGGERSEGHTVTDLRTGQTTSYPKRW